MGFLESGNMDAYFAQPTQGMQNALGEAMTQYSNQSETLYQRVYYQQQRLPDCPLAVGGSGRGAGGGDGRHGLVFAPFC